MKRIIKGSPVSGGIAVGEFYILSRESSEIPEFCGESPEKGLQMLCLAREKADGQLRELSEKASREGLRDAAALFEVHRQLLQDPDFTEAAEALILEGKSPAYAVREAGESFAAVFAALEDPYLRERGRDIRDLARRVCGILLGEAEPAPLGPGPYILAAEDLSPSETLLLDRSKIGGFALVKGSPLSHTALLSRSMGVPCVMALGDSSLLEEKGKTAVLNGNTGELFLDPDAACLQAFQEAEAAQKAERTALLALRELPCEDPKGERILLYTNISSPEEAEESLRVGADGVGLCRSEFLFRGREAPGEEEQLALYRKLLSAMEGRPLTVRTFDIGSDKGAAWMPMEAEANPALGLRGIRLSLRYPEILRTQFNALLRAGSYGKVRIMLPMIADRKELSAAREILEDCKAALKAKGLPFDEKIPLGVMIETPAAALVSDLLAEEADFFSIGSNDLTQYCLAADRQNPVLAGSFSHGNEAVLRLIRLTLQNAKVRGIPVSLCGEAAADPAMTKVLLDAGLRAFSLVPAGLLPLKKRILTLK